MMQGVPSALIVGRSMCWKDKLKFMQRVRCAMHKDEKGRKEWLQQYDALAAKFNDTYLSAKARG